MKPEQAVAIGQDALIWLAGEEDALGAFLNASGATPEDFRARGTDPEFLGFVLDFLLGDDTLVMGFARDHGLPPDLPARARMALGGGDPHWT